MNAKITEAASIVQKAQNPVVLTGAGVSKESGVPTFRDTLDGLWARYDPEQLATPQAFRANPRLVWDWYEYRRNLVRQSQPNPGHYALAALEKRPHALPIITQNVDDLHEQAGSENVIHLHGNIAQTKCFDDCRGKPTLLNITQLTWDAEAGPPKCPYCGAWARPNVVWFGELLPEQALMQAQNISESCDVMIVIGTSGLVTPAANMPRYAKSAGAMIIEVNPDYSMITRIADIKLEGASGEIMPKIIESIGGV